MGALLIGEETELDSITVLATKPGQVSPICWTYVTRKERSNPLKFPLTTNVMK